MDDMQEQELTRVEERVIRVFGGKHQMPLAGLSLAEARRRTVFTVVNLLLTGPDVPRHLLMTRDARIHHLSVRLLLDLNDAELLHDAFDAAALHQPREYPDIAMLLETARRMIGDAGVDATVGHFKTPSGRRH